MKRSDELRDVKLFHLRPCGNFVEEYLKPHMEDHIKCVTAFAGGRAQIVHLLRDGRAEFYPIPLSEVPSLFRSGAFAPDVFMCSVSPPDNHEYCSLGVSVDYARVAIETAGTVIAEVNENMPRTCGDSLVHVSEIDRFVLTSDPVYEMQATEVSNLQRLGENVASLVEDEATIQIGYGAVSESVAPFLKEKKNLGMHSEMLPESALTLVEQGALTCSKKTVNKDKIVCAFAAGTRRLYEWMDENPIVEMRPFDYTNDPRIIAANDRMTTINTALQVDLYGNTYSDVLGFDEYSGAGGQPDFVLGAKLSRNGRSIIAMPSTASDQVSKIVVHPAKSNNSRAPMLPTISRFHADYVVTEYGVASLRGKTASERAKALIDVSHPNFREQLDREATIAKLLK
jgi:4-hydroxybutyrate CoA-transferase